MQRLTGLVQHKLNNPLTALLAEAQLLAMQPGLSDEQRAAVQRVIDIVRRVIGIVRDLNVDVAERLER